MSGTQLTDGMVLDHVAEFAYFPSDRLQDLYAVDRVGYVDALNKFIQLVVTSDRLAMSAKSPNDDMGRLKETLGPIVDEAPFAFDLQDRSARRAQSFAWLTSHWEQIDALLLTERLTALALTGHVKREFERCFVLPEPRRESMANYVDLTEVQMLSPANLNNLASEVQSLRSFAGTNMDTRELTSWLLRTVTTHYRSFAEYGLFYRHQYTPSGTRSRLPIFADSPEQETLDTVTRCIAVDVLREAVRSGRRHQLAEVALDWRNTTKAETARTGLADLTDKFAFLDARGRKELVDDVNGILEADKGYQVGLVVGSMQAIRDTIALREAHANRALETPKPLRWLYALRSPDAVHELFALADQLVRS